MKKLTAMLLSLVMCFSLMAIPAQAAFVPDPDSPGIINVGGLKGLVDLGDEDPDKPGNSVQSAPPVPWPVPKDNTPID